MFAFFNIHCDHMIFQEPDSVHIKSIFIICNYLLIRDPHWFPCLGSCEYSQDVGKPWELEEK